MYKYTEGTCAKITAKNLKIEAKKPIIGRIQRQIGKRKLKKPEAILQDNKKS